MLYYYTRNMKRGKFMVNINTLMNITESYGNIYGSKLISQQLYLLIKREKLENIVELGTGLGVSSVWMGRALKENGSGSLKTFDNFNHSSELKELGLSQENIILENINDLNLNNTISICKCSIDLGNEEFKKNFLDTKNIDLVFSDFSHGIVDIQDIFKTFLPYLNKSMHIFIDSVPNNDDSKKFLEELVLNLNKSKIPDFFYRQNSKEDVWKTIQNILSSNFSLQHIVEKDTKHQGSTSWITIKKL